MHMNHCLQAQEVNVSGNGSGLFNGCSGTEEISCRMLKPGTRPKIYADIGSCEGMADC